MIKNRGAVLRSHVRPLPIRRSRIMALPEHSQQLQVRNLSRIKLHFHGLSMAGPARAANSSRSNALNPPEGVLHTPETTSSKSRDSHNANLLAQSIFSAIRISMLPQARVPVERAEQRALRIRLR